LLSWDESFSSAGPSAGSAVSTKTATNPAHD
jgi:hypothetical protein